MRKEYSDLPDKQKIIYYKRGVVFGICLVLPIALLFGSTFGIISYYAPLIEEQKATNSTISDIKPLKSNPVMESVMLLFFIIAGAGFMGLGTVGIKISDWVCGKLKLYTDFELEEAERRVAEIKKELSEN